MLSLSKLSRLIHTGEISPIQLLEDLLNRIDRIEPKIHAWVTIDRERAKATAEKLAEEAEEEKFRSALHGIPVGVKDIFYTEGLRTTMGSSIFRDFIPSFDADAVQRLRKAGAVVLGKTETTEFASSDPAPTRNPWNMEHTPGGSSSGSAAAVSSGMCPAAFGTQTGGSVIRPAAFCGVVGMKPTFDLISRRGVYPLSWTLDHVGFFTRTVEDSAIVLEAMTGVENPFLDVPPEESKPPRLGLLREYFQEKAHEDVWKGFEEAVERLANAGAEVIDIPLSECFDVVHAAHRIIMACEAASVHEQNFSKRRLDYRINIRGLIASGLLVSSADYIRARRMRSRFIAEVTAMIKDVSCLITPSSLTPALRGLGSTGDPAFNAPWSFIGFPSITVPSDLNSDELPLGIQLVGKPMHEKELLVNAGWFENILAFQKTPREPN